MAKDSLKQIFAFWPELLFILAVIGLLLQLFPSAASILVHSLDPKIWPRSIWFYGNVGIVISLLVWRFGPSLYHDWTNHRAELTAAREKRNRQLQMKAQREQIERMREASKRRIY